MHIEEEAITLLNRNGHYDLLERDTLDNLQNSFYFFCFILT